MHARLDELTAARIAAARRHREERDAFQAEHLRRRRHGLEARRAAKLARLAMQALDRQAGVPARRAGRRGSS